MAPQAIISLLLGVWGKIKDIKIFWALLRNWGFVKKSYETFRKIAHDSIERKHITCEETKEVLGLMRESFDRGLIDFDGVDEREIAMIIHQIEQNLVCSVLIHERKVLGINK